MKPKNKIWAWQNFKQISKDLFQLQLNEQYSRETCEELSISIVQLDLKVNKMNVTAQTFKFF